MEKPQGGARVRSVTPENTSEKGVEPESGGSRRMNKFRLMHICVEPGQSLIAERSRETETKGDRESGREREQDTVTWGE